MSHFSITVGAVTFSTSAPILACVLVTLALFFIPICVAWRNRKGKGKPPVQTPPEQPSRAVVLDPAPIVVQEIRIDVDGFSLMGDAWSWTTNLPISYGCPECGQRVNATLRQYYNNVSDETYSIFRHKCVPSLDTVPLQAIQWKEQER